MADLLEHEAVKRVQAALAAAGLPSDVIALKDSARSAEDAAAALGCPLGAIVKSLVFAVGNRFIMALVAGDHQCNEDALPTAFKMTGRVRRPQAAEVKGITGFSIGGVAPVGLTHPLPTVIDVSLKRFDVVYAAAGHPHCVFAAPFNALKAATAGIVSYSIGTPQPGVTGYKPAFARSKTFRG